MLLFDRVTLVSIAFIALFVIVGFPVFSLYTMKRLKKEIERDKEEIKRLIEKNKQIEDDEHEHPLVKRVNDLQKIRFGKNFLVEVQPKTPPVRAATRVLKKRS